MPVRVGINGFGRIGRNVFRAAQAADADIEWVAVNDLTDTDDAGAPAASYDSILGPYPGTVERRRRRPRRRRQARSRSSPSAIPARCRWGDLGVDVVLESTGFFTKRDDAAKHLDAGAKKVIISRARHRTRTSRSCSASTSTTLRRRRAPRHLQRVLHDELPRAGREGRPRRGRHRARPDDDDPRLHGRPEPPGRAAQGPAPRPRRRDQPRARRRPAPRRPSASCCPSSTASCTASRSAPRSRPARSSTSRSVARARRRVEEVNAAFAAAADRATLAGILQYTEDPIVSSDIVGNPHSSIVDGQLTAVIDGTLVKVVAWYDNEWGYSNRCVDARSRRCLVQCARSTTSATSTGKRVLVRVDFNVPLDGRRDHRRRPHPRRAADARGAARASGARLLLVVAPRAPEGPRRRSSRCGPSPSA